MIQEVKERQTDGISQYVREAVNARLIAEDEGEWHPPPDWIDHATSETDGGTEPPKPIPDGGESTSD